MTTKPDAPPLLTVQDLRIHLAGEPARELVHGINFSMQTECLAMVGESGSGKSLTARALMGLLPAACTASASRLELDGQDLRSLRERDWSALRGNQMAMVLQDPKYALNPVLPIGVQVAEPLLLHTRLCRKERHQKMLHMLDAVGLPDPQRLQQAYPHQLSGGMGQRVMLAMALITEPRLLIADEPTSALDAVLREQVLELMISLVSAQHTALLLISHDLPLVARYCQRVMVMHQGHLVDQLQACELATAQHPYTRTLWSCRPSRQTHGQMLPIYHRQLSENAHE